jgi:Fungal protein kinase
MSEDSRSQESVRQSTEAAKASKIEERIRHEFGNSWREDDTFLEKFFPVCSSWIPHIEAAQKRNYNAKTSRWKRIPKAPNAASKLYTPLRLVMNDILLAEEESRQRPPLQRKGIGQNKTERKSSHRYEEWWRTKHVRGVLATHAKNKRVYAEPHSSVSPTLYLAGGGSQVLGVAWTIVKSAAMSGISPIQVVLDSDDLLSARDRLAANVTHMMSVQTRRGFAYGLILTESTCSVYMFDHSGAVTSQPFNYHLCPAQFCAVLFGLGSDQGERLGFDRSIFADEKGILVRTQVDSGEDLPKEVHYVITKVLFRFSSLIGRGTVCWLTERVDEPHSQFVIKDAWIPREELSGRESEGSLLRHAQAKGVIAGVGQLEHFEEVRRSHDPKDLDTIMRNRQVDKPAPQDLTLERVHTRIVLRTFGETLDQFETRKDLLLAFHDAVLGASLLILRRVSFWTCVF